ncbi:MAG: ATP-binding protein, partial [Pseudomonadota bacterium]
ALLSDLADLSRLGAGRINLTSAPFNLRETVLSIARLLRPQANEKGLELFVRVPPGMPETLVGDAGRVRQLLVHLVGNALRFTEAGHVYIDLQIAQISQDIRSIQLSVSDTGPGFSTEELDRIFDAFEQCDGTDLGARLGLEICSQITNAMEGGLTVESELGQGSVFRFSVRLPVASTAQEQPGLDTSALAGVRVMVAASHPVQRRILVDYLNAFGVTTYEDTSAEQMITLLSGPAKSDETVDFILCDPKGRPDLPKMIDAQFASQPQERTPQFFVLAEPGAALPHLPHGAQTVATPVTPNALCYALLKSLGKREADQSNPDPKEESVPEVVDVAPKHAANDGPAVAASQRVLVIEPDLNARSSIEIILDKVDLSAAFVADAHAARSYLDKDQGFDALLIHLDGSETKDHPSFHFLHDLREVSEDRRRTIVGMIGPATRSVSRALVAQGLTHVIRKPVSADALSRILLSSRDETSPTAQSAPGDDRSAQTIKRAAG